MPIEITMPQLSDTMTRGTLVKWLAKEGETVKAQQIIAEVETDKATMEMETFDAGVIAYLATQEGDQIAVGGLLAVLAKPGENPADVKKQYSNGAAKPAATKAPVEAEKLVAAPSSSGSAPVATAPVASSPTTASRIRVSPLASRIAAENKVDLSTLQGSGPAGRIVQKDVLAAIANPQSGVVGVPSETLSQAAPTIPAAPVAMTKMRAAIAAALQRSKRNIPHFYETLDIDLEALVQLRTRINTKLEKEKVRLSLADFIHKAVATALLKHPAVNSHFIEDKNEIVPHNSVNLGIAVSIPDGLIVPVLRNIETMGLKEIRRKSVDLIERARAQRLKRDESSGATFSVTNLGGYGVREFSAIINPPEVGILAIGAAEQRPVVRDGQIVVRTILSVTLSCDHRVVDGAVAAEFLVTLKSLLEEPGLLLV